MLVWLVIVGGIGSIGRAAEKLSPLKVGLYLGGGLVVIVAFAANIPTVLGLVFREAFSLRATAGGALGMVVAMRYGLARGMYANEAGYQELSQQQLLDNADSFGYAVVSLHAKRLIRGVDANEEFVTCY